MRNVAWLYIAVGTACVPLPVHAVDTTPAQERAVLDQAIRLAGPHVPADLPFVLVSTLPWTVSNGAEAWTGVDEHGDGNLVFVYTGSRTFRCASVPHADQDRCLLKVASVIVHEAWHLRHGPDEARAYDAQLMFLQLNEASTFLQLNEASAADIREVRQARDRVLADRRRASTRARTTASPGASGAPPGP